MRLDDALRFDHTSAHPSQFFAPAHFATNERPWWAMVAIPVALLVLIVAVIAGKALKSKRSSTIFGMGALAVLVAASAAIAFRGESVHPLPTKSREFLQLSTQGDELALFSTRERALEAAKEASRRWDMPESTARVITYAWGEWPEKYVNGAPDHPRLADDDDGWNHGPYQGWNAADDAVVADYVKRTYGVTPIGRSRVEPVRQNLSPLGTLEYADPVRLPSGEARCILTFHRLTTNFMGGPVDASPDRLVCTTEPRGPIHKEPASPKLFYPPKVG